MYCGLDAENIDLMYDFTSRATSTSPVISAYNIVSLAMRALLQAVLGLSIAVLAVFNAVLYVCKAVTFKSASLGLYSL